MAKTITTVQTTAVVLVLNTNDNPLSITASGGVESSSGTAIDSYLGLTWTVTNAGTVSDSTTIQSTGIDLRSGGRVTNSGLISAYVFGVRMRTQSGTVTNSGRIASHTDGVVLSAGGSVTNAAGGQIIGTTNVGVYFTGGAGTVTNTGTITGGIDAVQFVGSFANRVIMNPGAVFNGTVAGGGGFNTLELASAAGSGTLSNFASGFTGFGSIVVDSGASWTADSSDTLAVGVTITDNGTLTNTGSIQGTTVTVTSGATLDNRGTITGSNPVLLLGGVLINEATASVGDLAGLYGVAGMTSPATVSNAGTIVGAEFGATLTAGGSIDNQASALLAGTFGVGAYIEGGGGAVTNAGTVRGQQNGVELVAGGSISNASGGRITGTANIGAYIKGGVGTITNAGTIKGWDGAVLLAGGAIVNQAGGLVTATANTGAYIAGGAGTITNAGTITGAVDAVQFIGSFTDRLIDVPGAVFSGAVMGGSGSNTLELAAGTSAAIGTLTNLGAQFTGFGDIVVDTGAQWEFDASDTFGKGAPVVDNGMMLFSEAAGTTLTVVSNISGGGGVTQKGGGTLLLSGNDSFSGGITIGGGTLELSPANLAGHGPIAFVGDTTLRVDGSIMPTGTLHGLAVGDRIARGRLVSRPRLDPARRVDRQRQHSGADRKQRDVRSDLGPRPELRQPRVRAVGGRRQRHAHHGRPGVLLRRHADHDTGRRSRRRRPSCRRCGRHRVRCDPDDPLGRTPATGPVPACRAGTRRADPHPGARLRRRSASA